MRLLSLTFILLLFATGSACAIPHKNIFPEGTLKEIPKFKPTDSMMKRLNQHDALICKIRATIGYESLQMAQAGVPEQKARAGLAKFLFSRDFDRLKFPLEETMFLSDIQEYAYKLYKQHPKADPIQLGNRLWNSCVFEKSALHASL